jgi:hypothetical protein
LPGIEDCLLQSIPRFEPERLQSNAISTYLDTLMTSRQSDTPDFGALASLSVPSVVPVLLFEPLRVATPDWLGAVLEEVPRDNTVFMIQASPSQPLDITTNPGFPPSSAFLSRHRIGSARSYFDAEVFIAPRADDPAAQTVWNRSQSFRFTKPSIGYRSVTRLSPSLAICRSMRIDSASYWFLAIPFADGFSVRQHLDNAGTNPWRAPRVPIRIASPQDIRDVDLSDFVIPWASDPHEQDSPDLSILDPVAGPVVPTKFRTGGQFRLCVPDYIVVALGGAVLVCADKDWKPFDEQYVIHSAESWNETDPLRVLILAPDLISPSTASVLATKLISSRK